MLAAPILECRCLEEGARFTCRDRDSEPDTHLDTPIRDIDKHSWH